MEVVPEVYRSPEGSRLELFRKIRLSAIILLVLAILATGGYFFYQQYRIPEEKIAVLNQLQKIETAIKNPDSQLLTKYQISEETIKTEQNMIIYGGDPTSIIKGRTNTPDSLRGISNILQVGNFNKTSKELTLENVKKIFQRASNLLSGKNGDDDIRWTKEQIKKIDPKHIFIPANLSGRNVSAIKEELVKEVIKLGYMLAK